MMRNKSVFQVLLLSMFVLLLPAWGGAQSTQDVSTSSTNAGSSSAVPTAQQEMRDELKGLRTEVERLRAEVEQQKSTASANDRGEAAPATNGAGPSLPAVTAANFAVPTVTTVSGQPAAATAPVDSAATKPARAEPFAFADWTWLNGNPRTKEAAFDSKFFTPEIRADVDYTYDFNHPKDDSIGGSSEIFRSNEVGITQLGVGGDFHYDHVRARLMTQFGLYSETTPRNDASYARGQWNLADAYRYVSEAYGGYHWDALHGVNVDAGIFMSYVGLFSYYNFDNWAYQPSYVSSNTPWFFTGMRIQVFPTAKLKIEPWIINGWQSYARSNGRIGLGGQILYRPNGAISITSNNYGVGADAFGIPNRTRVHTDNSIEVKYYDRPGRFLDKMAFSLTGDAGCETGGGVNCTTNQKNSSGQIVSYKQSFLGYMLYNRWWFHNDRYGFTVGGGKINNPGRYLVLLPPINGATAASGTPYFTENPGDPYKAWDISATYDYMPSQYITFRWEFNHRHANVPYWSGPGGVTPPGGNNGNPGATVAQNGVTWQPDLRNTEDRATMAILVKF
jgi:Putative beta-barrel porin-2, OmpL-like. bbp2